MRVFRSILGCMLMIIAVPVIGSPHLDRLNEEMAGDQGLKMCTQKTNLLDCPVVTGFYTSILDADYASIGWSDVNPGGGYTFQYGLAGYDYLNPDAGTSFYTENSSKTITGLQFETAYDVYVRSECSNPITSSEWAGPYTFTTYAEPFCDAPFNLALSDVGLDYASFTWSFPNSADGGKVQYGPVGHDPTQQSQGHWVSVFGPTVFTFEDLDPGTSYDFYVQSNCINPFADSEWAGPLTFQTEGYAGCDIPANVTIQEVGFGTTAARVKPVWNNIEGTSYCEVRGGRISPASLSTPQPVFANIYNLRTLTQTNGSELNFNVRLYTDAGYSFIVGETYGAEVRCSCENGEGLSGWSLLTHESIFLVPDPFAIGK